MIMDVFAHERDLCMLFLKIESNDCEIVFEILSKLVSISIFHTGSWNSVTGEFILNTLCKNFKLPIIGWKEKCKVLNDDNLWDLT